MANNTDTQMEMALRMRDQGFPHEVIEDLIGVSLAPDEPMDYDDGDATQEEEIAIET